MYPLRRTAFVSFAAERVVLHYLSRSYPALKVFLPIDDFFEACAAEFVEAAGFFYAFSFDGKAEQELIEEAFFVMTVKDCGVYLQAVRSLRVGIALQMGQMFRRQAAVGVPQGSRRQMVGTFYASVAFAGSLVRKVCPEHIVPISYEAPFSALRTEEFAAAPVQRVAVTVIRV